jgi:hypothetical protein
VSPRRQLRGARQTGPRTLTCKVRSSRNALRHGLAVPICHDPDFSPMVDKVAQEIAGSPASSTVMQLARLAAEAQLDVIRCRQARCRTVEAKQNETADIYDALFSDPPVMFFLLRKRYSGLPTQGLDDLPEEKLDYYLDRAKSRCRRALAKEFIAIDRYERRALTRRNRALQDLDCQRLIEAAISKTPW